VKIRSIAFLLIPVLLIPALSLLGQERTIPLTDAEGKPIVGPDGKPATVTLGVEQPAGGGPQLSALPPDKVVIAVGSEKLTAAELDRIIEVLPEQAQANARGQGRRAFAEDIVRLKLLAQEARQRKLDQSPGYRAQAAFQNENLLAGILFDELARTLPVD
jgi:hypothetical protein